MGYYNEADTRAKLIDPKSSLQGGAKGRSSRDLRPPAPLPRPVGIQRWGLMVVWKAIRKPGPTVDRGVR